VVVLRSVPVNDCKGQLYEWRHVGHVWVTDYGFG
jgi:hypothetical protein